ncbi:AAA family ATPase, partial [Thermodesulfobacteriota bacterium]
ICYSFLNIVCNYLTGNYWGEMGHREDERAFLGGSRHRRSGIMAIITISRGCFSHGKEIAERVSQMLGYECVSREILLEASRFFDVPEQKLLNSIHDAPTVLERITHGREKYLSYIRAALLEHVKRDNVVYHGHAGHLLIPEVPHVLKVRVIAKIEDRIAFLQQKESMPRNEAMTYIKNEDKQRAEWTRYLYKTEVSDPCLYDIVINIGSLTIESASEFICEMAASDTFKATPESQKLMNDLAVSSHVQAALQETCDAAVTSDNGVVRVRVGAQKLRKTGFAAPELQRRVRERIREDLMRDIVQIAKRIPGVREVVCDVDLPYYS